MTVRRVRKRKQLLNVLKEKRGYWKLKEEALDRKLCRIRFGRGNGPIVTQTTVSMNTVPWIAKCVFSANFIRLGSLNRRSNAFFLNNGIYIIRQFHRIYLSTEWRLKRKSSLQIVNVLTSYTDLQETMHRPASTVKASTIIYQVCSEATSGGPDGKHIGRSITAAFWWDIGENNSGTTSAVHLLTTTSR